MEFLIIDLGRFSVKNCLKCMKNIRISVYVNVDIGKMDSSYNVSSRSFVKRMLSFMSTLFLL